MFSKSQRKLRNQVAELRSMLPEFAEEDQPDIIGEIQRLVSKFKYTFPEEIWSLIKEFQIDNLQTYIPKSSFYRKLFEPILNPYWSFSGYFQDYSVCQQITIEMVVNMPIGSVIYGIDEIGYVCEWTKKDGFLSLTKATEIMEYTSIPNSPFLKKKYLRNYTISQGDFKDDDQYCKYSDFETNSWYRIDISKILSRAVRPLPTHQ